MNEPIVFNDGAAYERYMGKWSQLVGDAFLDWLAPASGLRWLDVGCGNGAFTERFVERFAPASVRGIDPSEEQLAYARAQASLSGALFLKADAMALPFPDNSFDVAVMPLVIFFVPDPARGVAEMARVVSPRGTVSAYAWDMIGGGFPYELLRAEMRDLGSVVPTPPSPDASEPHAMRDLWTRAGLDEVSMQSICVERSFVDFEEYWEAVRGGPSVRSRLAAMAPETLAVLRSRMHMHLAKGAAGRITCSARAHAIKGRVPE